MPTFNSTAPDVPGFQVSFPFIAADGEFKNRGITQVRGRRFQFNLLGPDGKNWSTSEIQALSAAVLAQAWAMRMSYFAKEKLPSAHSMFDFEFVSWGFEA